MARSVSLFAERAVARGHAASPRADPRHVGRIFRFP